MRTGVSLTTYLRNHLVELARKPSMAELYERSSRRDQGVLAEQLDVPLVTCDARLAGASGHSADVEVYPIS
ncbi:hypothetical protein ABZX92_44330 [Lentzea sp. NPDC006480]|uniref:hypothetical protein n=1 Tax=Lentzea sp. NPDC006480 TaxID=3157176 RepID=UPI0033A98351